ncbi:GNAT family N-acetyltransferase [Pantoea sp. 1.19]|uniref:GNAT family N-acetyltransferase n=1 Tax=Pantoea sp. 1.19 TaxID=1925589 RepID=UPI00094899BC|nr:GNAT family N-acetyltransferase [Pantoea sp. 1.19]
MHPLHFRPLEHGDAPAFAQAVNASLDTLLPWMCWAHAGYTEADATAWITLTQVQRRLGEADELGIFSEDGQLLGGAGLRFSSDPQGLTAIGYWVRSAAQNQGIATQAVNYLARLAIPAGASGQLEILVAEQNLASRRVAEKSGARLVGMRFGLIVLDSGPVNTAVYHLSRTARPRPA